jgi:acetyl-CoA C-acetyltransferase
MTKDVVIVGAARTPIGSFGGALSSLPASELGRVAIEALLTRSGVAPEEVDEVILGQILTANTGQNPARQAAMAAGIPQEKTAYGINQLCGSGLRSVALAAQGIALGDADVVIAGGQENMSCSPHVAYLRDGTKMGELKVLDTLLRDGLNDVFQGYHMGVTAENIAKRWNLSREEQDAFAAASQQKVEAAQKAGRFDEEIVPVTVKHRKGDQLISVDEFPRAGTTQESLSGLRPAFDRNGTVTAGNASGINDGAAALLLMSADRAEEKGLASFGRIVSWATCGVDPEIMGTGPIPASRKALGKAGWTVEDLDLIEANEAFAAQALAVNREMAWDTDKVNVNGGAIALGHPIGASGARVLVTLLHEMQRRDARKAIATLCIGGGMGIALCVERNSS